LEKNTLARALEKYLAWLQPHLKWVAVAILVVLLGFGVNAFIAQQSASRMEAAWDEFLYASAATDRRKALEDVAAVHESLPAGIWALHSKADMDLQQGTQQIYQNRAEAEQLLRDAIAGFEEVLTLARRQPFLAQRAQYGIALANETMGELKKAREAYEEVVRLGESNALAELAQQRMDRLQSDRIQTFYNWFVAQDDPPPASRTPDLPRDLGDLPDFPDFQMPPDFSLPDLDLPGAVTPDEPVEPSAPVEPSPDPESVGPETPAEPETPEGEMPAESEEVPSEEEPQ
jgi:tetratricopeptide (TPR) repeat protein